MPIEVKRSMVTSLKEQREVISHLIEIFGLPRILQSLKVEWNINSLLTVECKCIPEYPALPACKPVNMISIDPLPQEGPDDAE